MHCAELSETSRDPSPRVEVIKTRPRFSSEPHEFRIHHFGAPSQLSIRWSRGDTSVKELSGGIIAPNCAPHFVSVSLVHQLKAYIADLSDRHTEKTARTYLQHQYTTREIYIQLCSAILQFGVATHRNHGECNATTNLGANAQKLNH